MPVKLMPLLLLVFLATWTRADDDRKSDESKSALRASLTAGPT